ncbi:bifunctional diguanylate cyclase/phosphodiesterase [Telluria aromaticivorans]|uniref:EAL domain-containing protein n=1 Tax=Telluria aromaticivorans TaxID=2725995 RepID=A0A7Y2P1K5_9BURK|nr:EAL domain-containing protein [Telluria aromaticivorans]
MRNYKNWSVRHLLYSLTAAAVLPASILLTFSVWNQYKTDELEAARSAYSLAQLTANNLQELLSDARHVLDTLAKRPGVRAVSGLDCDQIFGQFTDLYPQFSNLSKADRRGYIVCSAKAQPHDKPTFVGDALWYKRVSATQKFTLGSPYLGPVTGRVVAVLAHPLFDDAGVMTGSIQMPIDLAKLRVVVGAEKLPESTVIAVIDSRGVLVARSRGAEGLVGKDLSDTSGVKSVLATKDGTGRAVTSDGIERIIGFLPIPGTDWFAVAGIDTEAVLFSARQAALRNLVFGGLTLLLVFALALYVSKRISRPMMAVQEAARRAAAGDLDARVPYSGPLEVVDFAAQFNHMLDAIRASQNKLADAKSELVLLGTCLSHLTDMVIIMDAGQAAMDWPPIIFVNDAFEGVTGYPRDEVLGRPSSLLHGPATSSEAIAGIRAGFLAQAPFREELVHYTRNGVHFWVELDMIPIRNPAGALTHWVSIERDVTLRKLAEQSIHRLAYYDVLTGLPNRSLLMSSIDAALAMAACNGQMGAVLFVDLDHFKNINDARGHAVGDAFLQAVAQRLASTVHQPGTLARLGGDEFVILLTGLAGDERTSESLAMVEAGKVCRALARPFEVNGQPYISSASIGVTLLRGTGQSTHDLLRESDTAMYRAKKRGRNHAAFFTQDMQVEVELRLALENELACAIANQEMTIYVQTQVDCEGQPAGAEFLLRWRHPVRGQISPAQFIPVAEESGLILGLGAWVLGQACMALSTLSKVGHRLPVSVNVSPRQFHQPGFVAQVKEILATTGAPAGQLILEVTESLLIDDLDEAIGRMNELAALGIRFSIDDFGTGYSSLAYLKRLPLHELKIDKSFVQDTPHNGNDTAIVNSILSMARHLNLKVVAEGVETRAQAEFLIANHCHVLQGYFYSRPEDIEQWLSRLLAAGSQEN